MDKPDSNSFINAFRIYLRDSCCLREVFFDPVMSDLLEVAYFDPIIDLGDDTFGLLMSLLDLFDPLVFELDVFDFSEIVGPDLGVFFIILP